MSGSQDPLAGSAQYILAIRDGMPFGEAPHRQREDLVAVGCVVEVDFDDPAKGIQFSRGMVGFCYKQHGDMSLISIPRIIDELIWVDTKWLRVGNLPHKDWKEWEIVTDLRPIQLKRTTRASSHDADDQNNVLRKAILTFLQLLLDEPKAWASADTIKQLGGVNIIADVMCEGISRAGLNTILNQPDFTIHDLIHHAAYRIDGAVQNTGCGVYFRDYETGDTSGWWSPNSTYLYVGNSIDFRKRFVSHAHFNMAISHDRLKAAATTTVMAPLCVLETQDRPLRYICEQVLVCLLESYRDNLFQFGKSPGDTAVLWADERTRANVINALYFDALADEMCAATGWPGAVRRPDFGAQEGVNVTSPLQELSSGQASPEATLWTRNDDWHRDPETGEVYEMATFARGSLRSAKYTLLARKSHVINFFNGPDAPAEHHLSVIRELPPGSKIDGTEWPAPGAPYRISFEVRLDAKPHPISFARLALIGPYENWDRANSWAMRIEWEHPQGSGMWRFRYLQSRIPMDRHDRNVPGSLVTYAHGIRVIHWLFNEVPNYSHDWLPNWRGFAHVQHIKYDWIQQKIFIAPQQRKPVPVGGHPRDPSDVLRQMQDPRYGLQGAGDNWSNRPEPHTKNITGRCDSCIVTVKAQVTPCVAVPGTTYCVNCRDIWGRQHCSWTPGLKSYQWLEMHPVSDSEAQYRRIQDALVCLIEVNKVQGSFKREHELRGLQDMSREEKAIIEDLAGVEDVGDEHE